MGTVHTARCLHPQFALSDGTDARLPPHRMSAGFFQYRADHRWMSGGFFHDRAHGGGTTYATWWRHDLCRTVLGTVWQHLEGDLFHQLYNTLFLDIPCASSVQASVQAIGLLARTYDYIHDDVPGLATPPDSECTSTTASDPPSDLPDLISDYWPGP